MKNPLSKILDLIPYLDTHLNMALLDEMRVILAKSTKYTFITDKYIELLLAFLADEGLIKFNLVTFNNTTITFIRKLHYGKE